MTRDLAVLSRLEATIKARKEANPKDSYVASLLAGGGQTVARKLGEEALETVIAALGDDPEALVAEGADLIFHLLVLLAHHDRSIADIAAELERREGTPGHAEKAARGQS